MSVNPLQRHGLLLVLLAAGLWPSVWAQPGPACAVMTQDVQARAIALGLEAEVTCQDPKEDEATSWSVAAAPVTLRSGHQHWPVRQQFAAGPSRVRYLPVDLRLSSWAWVLVRDVNKGDVVRAVDVEHRRMQWPMGEQLQPVADPVVADSLGRATRALRAGHGLGRTDVVPTEQAMARDAVRLLMSTGDLVLELPARMVVPARLGQVVQVQVEGRPLLVSGRLVAPGRVESRVE